MATSDRLTVQLEDGCGEQLRILAGGPRKVGEYLSGVTAWLWAHREQLESAPLSDFVLCPRSVLESYDVRNFEADLETVRGFQDALSGIERRLRELDDNNTTLQNRLRELENNTVLQDRLRELESRQATDATAGQPE